MRSPSEYELFCDPETNERMFGDDTPFNLESDLRTVRKTIKPPDRLTDEIVFKCMQKSPKAILVVNDHDVVHRNAIRVVKYDVLDDRSKKAFRFIILIDDVHRFFILLHVYEKSVKSDLDQHEKKALASLVENYSASCR